MEQQPQNTRLRNAGFLTFFFSGICAISSGVVVSLLQEKYGFAYGMTGALLSLMSIGNLLAGFLTGVLPGVLGFKPSVLLLTTGYALGYGMMGLCGALLCPFLIAAAGRVSTGLALLVLAALGVIVWFIYLTTPMDGQGSTKSKTGKEKIDWSFLHSVQFWLLTGLLFCQNAAEQSVTGWMVTYFKGSGIITGAQAAYTVTVMWGATLVARLLIAFVFPFKQPRKAMVVMGVGCTIFYFFLMQAHTQGAAILLLFAFAFAMAGMNPTAVASAGKMTSVTSMGIMLPAASSGAILMPWIIGRVAERAGLAVGMACNIVPCIGLVLFAILVARMPEEN